MERTSEECMWWNGRTGEVEDENEDARKRHLRKELGCQGCRGDSQRWKERWTVPSFSICLGDRPAGKLLAQWPVVGGLLSRGTLVDDLGGAWLGTLPESLKSACPTTTSRGS